MLWRLDRLEFESGVFGAPVGRLAPDREGEGLDGLSRSWVEDGLWLVSARIAAADEAADQDLRRGGFTPIETLVTLERGVPAVLDMPGGVRPADAVDAQTCLRIARAAFRCDRFHVDPRVPEEGADRLKETWVANSLAGRADVVLVAEKDAVCVGFVTCMVHDDAAAIDLIAVAPEGQGRGVGKRLVQGALAYYAGQKSALRVGTQDTNTHSLALYEGQGFKRAHTEVTYHWVNEGARP